MSDGCAPGVPTHVQQLKNGDSREPPDVLKNKALSSALKPKGLHHATKVPVPVSE
jgi:hypothetical protein